MANSDSYVPAGAPQSQQELPAQAATSRPSAVSAQSAQLPQDLDVSDTAGSDKAAQTQPGEFQRPSDDQILSYENQLRAEQNRRPLLGSVQPLADLEAEYMAGSHIFVTKIQRLKETYPKLRRTRQDGNCFYRSFWFGLLEKLIMARDAAQVQRLKRCMESWKDKLVEAGFQLLVFEDALELVLELLQNMLSTQDMLTTDELLLRMCDENLSAYMIMLIRMITSAEIRLREDHFLPFVIGMTDGSCMDVDDFRRRHVEAMGEESDHIQLVAVADAFQVHIRVAYLDNSGIFGAGSADELSCQIHDFKPDIPAERLVTPTPVTVLYRPGHYDILYAQSGAA